MLVDETFYSPRTPVAVVAVGDTGEALLVRSILENLGAAVLLHLIGTPDDLLRVLGQGDASPRYLIICGHGDKNGLVLGEYGAGIDVTELVDGSMPPAAMAPRIVLPGRLVVSTACVTGSDAFGAAFLRGGVAAYVAPDDYPDGGDAVLFVHLLFHRILRGAAPAAALREIQRYDEAFGMFRMFAAPERVASGS